MIASALHDSRVVAALKLRHVEDQPLIFEAFHDSRVVAALKRALRPEMAGREDLSTTHESWLR